MNKLRKYINFHFRIIEDFLQWVILSVPSRLFIPLFNLRACMFFKDVRIKYDNAENKYIAYHKDLSCYFLNRVQAYDSYSMGMNYRATELGHIYFLDKLNFKNGDVIIDCGANVGDLLLYLKSLKEEIKYIGIEPSPSEFECLSANAKGKHLINKGLWDKSIKLDFYVSSDGADSSIIEPHVYTHKKTIDAIRLDEILTDHIKLLKVEAEGAEPEVLAGTEKLLNKIEYISADLGFERGKNQDSTFVPTVNYLLNNDFELLEVSHSDRIVGLFHNKNYVKT